MRARWSAGNTADDVADVYCIIHAFSDARPAPRIMPRKFFKRYLPDHKTVREQWFLRPFEALLHDPALIHPNRRTASLALAIGLFWAFVPIPLQMVPAALIALWWRVNVPIAIAAVWISNPFTAGPIFYAQYRIGTWLLGQPPGDFHFELSLDWLMEGFMNIWQPMLLGTLVFAVLTSIIGYVVMNRLWMISVMRRYKARPHFTLHPFRRRPK